MQIVHDMMELHSYAIEVEVWEWITNFIQHFAGHVINPCQ